MKLLRRIICWLGWHGKPVYTYENFNYVGRCPHCKRKLLIDTHGLWMD